MIDTFVTFHVLPGKTAKFERLHQELNPEPGEARARADHGCEREAAPRRFIAGADAIAAAEQKIADLKAQIEAHRELSTSLAFD